MLKNINTKQTQDFYSKDAKLNSKIHEQIQLKFFSKTFLQQKKRKKKYYKKPPMGNQEKNKQSWRREKRQTSGWGPNLQEIFTFRIQKGI